MSEPVLDSWVILAQRPVINKATVPMGGGRGEVSGLEYAVIDRGPDVAFVNRWMTCVLITKTRSVDSCEYFPTPERATRHYKEL